ncbi:RNA polymerase sigma factor [Actinomadura oligospora]|uniref:RNA polymerase sigma factor n=1 Tax=Actinomadura oligospora TaxID=111804 RepID=UPI00047D6D29|nr:RNA polymerase sigma factor [Actinomadura oligospora]
MAEPGATASGPPDRFAVTADLVRRAQRGDAVAVNDLLDVLTPYVTRLCGPIALQDSADAAQEALLAVFQGLRNVRDPDAFYSWVRTTTVREAVRVARRNQRQIPTELDVIPDVGSPELAADVRDVLDRLSPEHRAILVLREIEGLDEKTAADRLTISPGTAKSRLSRAKSTFRKAWTS